MLSSIGGNPRYRGENIMKLNLDHPARKTFKNQIEVISKSYFPYLLFNHSTPPLTLSIWEGIFCLSHKKKKILLKKSFEFNDLM